MFSFWAEQANRKYILLFKLYFWLKARRIPLKSSKQQFIRLFQLYIPKQLTHSTSRLVFPLCPNFPECSPILDRQDCKKSQLYLHLLLLLRSPPPGRKFTPVVTRRSVQLGQILLLVSRVHRPPAWKGAFQNEPTSLFDLCQLPNFGINRKPRPAGFYYSLSFPRGPWSTHTGYKVY